MELDKLLYMAQKITLKSKKCLVILPYSNSGWQRFILKYLQNIFEANSLQCDHISAQGDDQNVVAEKIINLIADEKQPYDFIFTFNRVPASRVILNDGLIDLFSIASAPVVTWYIDNIGHHISGLPEKISHQEVFLVADSCSIETGQKFDLPLSEKSFFPMWGPPAPENLEISASRDIPVLFSGDLLKEESLENLKDRIVGKEDFARAIVDKTIERMVDKSGREDCFSILISEITDRGFKKDAALSLFPSIDQWLRRRARLTNLRQFTSVPITICGKIEDREICSRPNVTILGSRSVEEVTRIARRSRIFLGDFANFVSGVEIRPAMAFSTGCVFACYENEFVEKNFPKSSYVGLACNNQNPESLIVDIINDFDRLNCIGRNAARHYNAGLHDSLSFLE